MDVRASLSIGEYSRATYLSVKTLRHYHEVGLLEPAHVDPFGGYRYYRPDQIGTALIIRRLRDLEMPVERVKGVLDATDMRARQALIAAHLRDMEERLERTAAAVTALRTRSRNRRAPRRSPTGPLPRRGHLRSRPPSRSMS